LPEDLQDQINRYILDDGVSLSKVCSRINPLIVSRHIQVEPLSIRNISTHFRYHATADDRKAYAERIAGRPVVPEDAYERFGVSRTAPAPEKPKPAPVAAPAAVKPATSAGPRSIKVASAGEVPAAVETALTGAGFKVLRGTSPDGGVRLTVRSAQSQTLGHIDVASSGEVRPNIFKQVSAVNAALPKVEISPA
jgi:hypothetical protein